MDEFNYLQFLNDDSELLEAEEVLLGECPTFSVQFDEYFDNISSTSAPDACDRESSNKETNPEPTHSLPQSPSFLGHVVGKRGALDVQNLQISLLMLITGFCPSPLHWGKNFTL